MSIRLVRHAKAGNRHDWSGKDVNRPLTEKGWIQASGLAIRLAPTKPPRLLSSPYLRCVQTLQPLAETLGLEVEASDLLREGAPWEPALDLLLSIEDGSVVCSHGDLIPDLIAALDRRQIEITGMPDWRKAATWVLTRSGEGPEALIVSATTEPPPV